MNRRLFSPRVLQIALLTGGLWFAFMFSTMYVEIPAQITSIVASAPTYLFMIYLPLMLIDMYRSTQMKGPVLPTLSFWLGSSIGGIYAFYFLFGLIFIGRPDIFAALIALLFIWGASQRDPY